MKVKSEYEEHIPYKKIFKNREKRLRLIGLLRFIPSSLYLKMVFKIKSGKKLNLKNPKTFCDKLNWLKLHNIHEEYTDMADKIRVRQIVNVKMGREMFFPLLGMWERYEDIDFSTLPRSFVLKCNHDSGSVRIIDDKTQINHEELKKYFNKRLKRNPYYVGREYPYRHIKPMILAEQNMNLDNPNGINDYKFFCFNGEPQLMYIATERNSSCKFDFFDMDFNHLDITNIHPHSDKEIDKPICFEEMKAVARTLSQGMPFVRIDLYEIKGRIYFGEYTFFHGGGFWPFKPEKWELKYGDMISLKAGDK